MLNRRGSLVVVVLSVLAVACGGSSGDDDDDDGGGFDVADIAELNGIWTLSADFGFLCDGTPINQRLVGVSVYVLDGQFEQVAIPLPSPVCNVSTLKFQGAIDLTGAVSGNFAVNGAPLIDTFAGTCETPGSCSGATENTSLFSYSMTNSGDSVFDGTWMIAVDCTDGSHLSALSLGSATVTGGQLSAAGMMTQGCDAAGLTSYVAQDETLSGTVSGDGALAATLTQGATGDLTFAGSELPTLISLRGTGNLGTTLSLTRAAP